MSTTALKRREPRLIDLHPPRADIRADVIDGLGQEQKELSPKYFYDQRGSHLFEDITRLPEYYLTRTEDAIMHAHLPEMARRIGPGAAVIEFGSGTGVKIRRLLKFLESPVAGVTVEISREHLLTSTRSLATDRPELEVIAVCADFTRPFALPPISGAQCKLVFFPGSTIGNFNPDEAIELLKVMHQVAGPGGGLLIGVDLAKDIPTLEAAYNDSQGVTAAFNLNLLHRINTELHADFDLEAFHHQAVYNQAKGRIEMYLVSQQAQEVHINGKTFAFSRGERILTEHSYKYVLSDFANLVAQAGFEVKQTWTDPQDYFSVQYLETSGRD
jgi:dimethylhistidine N-methyltransferase